MVPQSTSSQSPPGSSGAAGARRRLAPPGTHALHAGESAHAGAGRTGAASGGALKAALQPHVPWQKYLRFGAR